AAAVAEHQHLAAAAESLDEQGGDLLDRRRLLGRLGQRLGAVQQALLDLFLHACTSSFFSAGFHPSRKAVSARFSTKSACWSTFMWNLAVVLTPSISNSPRARRARAIALLRSASNTISLPSRLS